VHPICPVPAAVRDLFGACAEYRQHNDRNQWDVIMPARPAFFLPHEFLSSLLSFSTESVEVPDVTAYSFGLKT
jgi:hypothetical protein